MSSPPPGGRSLRGPAIRFALLLLLLAAGFLLLRFTPLGGYLTAEKLQSTLASLRGLWWAPLVHVGLLILLGPLGAPATPFLLAGAAIFGPRWGLVWNFVGVLVASCAGFGLARLLGREFIERLGGEKVRRVERLLQRRGFVPLVAARFLPIPFQLLNAAAAVVGVRFSKFLAASAIGLFPPIAILTYFASALLRAAAGSERSAVLFHLLLVSALMIVLVFLPIAIWRRRRIWRLSRLRSARSQRGDRREPPEPDESGPIG